MLQLILKYKLKHTMLSKCNISKLYNVPEILSGRKDRQILFMKYLNTYYTKNPQLFVLWASSPFLADFCYINCE